MKKLITLLVVFFIATNSTLSQVDSKSEQQVDGIIIKKNEVKANVAYAVFTGLEISYERLLNKESGVGVSLYFAYAGDEINDVKFYALPYYRFYFGNKYASGLFIEGFGVLNTQDGPSQTNFEGGEVVFFQQEDDLVNFGLGFGVGGKWYTNKGLMLEVGVGVARNIVKGDDLNTNDYFPRAAITLGYRF